MTSKISNCKFTKTNFSRFVATSFTLNEAIASETLRNDTLEKTSPKIDSISLTPCIESGWLVVERTSKLLAVESREVSEKVKW